MGAIEWLLAHGADLSTAFAKHVSDSPCLSNDPSTAFAKHVPIHRASWAVLKRLIDAGAKAPPDIEQTICAGKW